MKITKFALMTTAAFLAFAPMAMADDAGDFVKNASIANQFEIDSSKLALEKSQNADVKAFAQKMIDDHTKAGNDLKAALPKSGVDKAYLRDVLDDKHQGMMKDLKDEAGNDFDNEYVSKQVAAHDEAVTLFQDYSEDGENAVLKDFATKTLPTLKMHQDHVNKLDEAMDKMDK